MTKSKPCLPHICDLCMEVHCIDDEDLNLYKKIFNDTPLEEFILHKQGLFSLIPAIGALIDGHCLLVPEFHFSSYSELLHYSPDYIEKSILDSCKILANLYSSDVVAFEHGPIYVNHGDYRNQEDHAHLHIMPLGFDIEKQFLEYPQGLQWDSLGSLSQLGEYYRKKSYLLYLFCDYMNNLNGLKIRCCTFDDDSGVIKQFFRRVVARSLNREADWEWEKNFGEPYILNTIEKFTKAKGGTIPCY